MKPSEFLELGENERFILKVFMVQELEDRKQEVKAMSGGE